MRDFFFDLFIDELFGILPRPLRWLLWMIMAAAVIGFLAWLVLR